MFLAAVDQGPRPTVFYSYRTGFRHAPIARVRVLFPGTQGAGTDGPDHVCPAEVVGDHIRS